MTIPRVLTIAGSDSGGGAGIQADIKTITMLGGHAMTAITAITAQNTLGVIQVLPIPTGTVLAQIDAVLGDIGVDAVKIGMIGSAEAAHAIAARLQALQESGLSVPIVFDPVMIATSGVRLADDETIAAFAAIMRCAQVVTPNVPELEALTGMAIANVGAMMTAAAELAARENIAVLAKGGHLPGEEVIDLFVFGPDGASHVYDPQPRIRTRHDHGTGCTLSSALATGLACGKTLIEAASVARDYVRAALEAAPALGQGHGPLGHALGKTYFR